MEFILIVAISISFFVYVKHRMKKEQEAALRKQAILDLAYKTQNLLEKISTQKTTSARVNNCGKAVRLLEEAELYPECRDVISNFDELKSRLKSIQKVLPVVDAVEKSYKHRFKDKYKAELNALQDALYHIRDKSITNDDFSRAMVFSEDNGELSTLEGIEERCRELGWEPKKSI